MSAKEAYKAYIRAYDSHHLKTIFDVHTLDLARVAQSFGFKVPPVVDLSKFDQFYTFYRSYIFIFDLILLDMRSTKADRPRKRQGNFGDTGGGGAKHRTKASIYRQVGKPNDKRQFSR